jgi:glycosyltransferase involved in cell wall biosynthesis
LFYARPTHGLRNLFEMGVAALEKAVSDGTFDPQRWEFVGMGESFRPVPLGRGATLVPAPWLDLAGYAKQMRDSDILLSPMLSPHPSYPPLEMAACGGVAVTTVFANKTPEALAALSANLIGVAPTVEGLAGGLAAAIARVDDLDGRRAAAAINLPESWRSSLALVIPRLFDELAVLQGSPMREGGRSPAGGTTSMVAPGFRNWPRDEYEVHRLQAFARRSRQYPLRQEPGLFSLLTTVWNTPPALFEALAESVLAQDADATFEWVLLDNGSSDPDTRRSVERLAGERGVNVLRVEENLGIVGGMRFCLERATHRYVLPVDSDDLLTPDCLRVLAHALRQAGYPALAYTDEDHLEGNHFSQPYFKPAFDPVLYANSCYTAHLGVIDRKLALELGAYTDPRAEGSHDWDTFTRFLAAGHTPHHIAEVLYSWRIHATSTSGNIHSKPFVYDSQRCVLTKLLETLAPGGRFRLEPSPLFSGMPDWWMRRDATDPRAITTVVLGSSRDRLPRLSVPNEVPHQVVHLDPAEGAAGLARLAARIAESGRLLHVVWHDTRIVDDAWALEAMGLFELVPDTAIVGGRLHQRGRVVDAGRYFGFGRGCDAPDRGRPLEDPGYHAQAWKQHSVSAVALDHVVLDPEFARGALADLARAKVSLAHLGAWLGAACRRQDRRVVYSPFLSAEPTIDRTAQISDVEHDAFRRANADLMPDPRYWSPHVAMRAPAYRPASIEVRRRPIGDPGPSLTDADMLAADRIARALLPPPSSGVSFSILTSVYARTPAQFFDRTARSVFEQRDADFEWIVLENGPVPDDVTRVLDRIAADPRVRRFACAENAGIQGALRQCLARASRAFVVPLDADDVLEPDALRVLAGAIDREQADFVFSDEDHVTGDRVHTPYARPGFDPVLNLESSYIWHLCAFNRERAIEVGVYSNDGAEYCHDWDTIVRFSEAGLRIAHVPHVLYHWRTHAASQSNTETQNPGSLASMRAVVEGVLARRGGTERYEIAEFPLFRGAVEWWIRRRPVGDPCLAVVVLGADQGDVDALKDVPGFAVASRILPFRRRLDTLADWRALADVLPRDAERIVLADLRCRPATTEWVWEAMKWFELQPDTAIVGGRILDDRDVVVDAGSRVIAGETVALYQGLRRGDAGAFALALKPQTIETPADGLLVVERRFLEAAIAHVSGEGCAKRIGETLGAFAKMERRRVVYSPLVEARRMHGRDDAARIDDAVATHENAPPAPRAAGTAPSNADPAGAALRLIAPSDWQQVGTRPEFSATGGHDVRAEVLLFGRDDYLGKGPERARCLASVRLEPDGDAGALAGRPAAPLPEGDYIAALKDSTGTIVSVSGVCLRDARERWPLRFEAMLEDQARFGNGHVAPLPRREGEPLFSITTAVYDVDPPFVTALADSILGQRFDDFEWVLLDNGSLRADVQQVCRDVAARDPRVHFWRVDDNLHIIGGNRFLLERARGTYVVPVDGDDVLYPDALRILSIFIAEHQAPDLLYSDEQKITSKGKADEIVWRPGWSNLAALSTCPAAHLMVFKRTLALDAGFYSDDYARGSHDWDSALRLATRTSHIVHVPFVLYGWRMHAGSSALNVASKNYLAESQKSVVRHALERLDLADRFEVDSASDVLGYYHAVRRKQDGPRVVLHAVIPEDAAHEALKQLRASLARTRYDDIALRIYVPADPRVGAAARKIRIGSVAPDVMTYRDQTELRALMFASDVIDSGGVHVFLNPFLAIANPDWIWEAVATFELDPSTGIAGGCIVQPDGRVSHIGYVSGLGGFFATPGYHQDMRVVHGHIGFIRRNVTAVYGSFMAVKQEVLRKVGGLAGIDWTDGLHGIEFCLRAARHGIKTGYSPRMKASLRAPLAQPAGADRDLAARIVAEYPDAGAVDPYYSPHCIPSAEAFGSPIV